MSFIESAQEIDKKSSIGKRIEKFCAIKVMRENLIPSNKTFKQQKSVCLNF
jgi:hypothetical protein